MEADSEPMKYWLIILSFLLPPIFSSSAQTPPAPQHVERGTGYADVARGIYLKGPQEDIPAAILRKFQAESIPFSWDTPVKRGVTLEIRPVESIPFPSAENRHAYRVHVSAASITIEYSSMPAAFRAIETLGAYYRKHLPSGVRRKRLPAVEMRGWASPGAGKSVRIHAPASDLETVFPFDAESVEVMLTHPEKGWLIPGDTLPSIHYSDPIHTGEFYPYAELNTWPEKFGSLPLPVFDLTTPNQPFESVTGHPMLSVEGMRFVRLLLDEFFRHTTFRSVAFIVPEGRYRTQIEQIVRRHPHVTGVDFLEE